MRTTAIFVFLFLLCSFPGIGLADVILDCPNDVATWSGTVTLSNEDYWIEDDCVLTVEAGTTVKVHPGRNITVSSDGSIDINGTSQSPVLFTTTETTINSYTDHWGSLIIKGGIHSISYVTFEYGGNNTSALITTDANVEFHNVARYINNLTVHDSAIAGIRANACILDMSECDIYNSNNDGIMIDNITSGAFNPFMNLLRFTLADSTIEDNGGSGIEIYKPKIALDIDNCLVDSNNVTGILVDESTYSTGAITVTNSDVTNNSATGFEINNTTYHAGIYITDTTTQVVTFEYNNIVNIQTADPTHKELIYNATTSTNSDFTPNYWGVTGPLQVAARINHPLQVDWRGFATTPY